jgi:hypothetical protein
MNTPLAPTTRILILATLSMICVLMACDAARSTQHKEDRAPTTPPEQPATTRPDPLTVTPLPADVHRGICLAHNWQDRGEKGYGSEANADTLAHLGELGANWVSLTPFGWMKTLNSLEIQGEHLDASKMPAGAETRARLTSAIAQARTRGLRVMLKPHVWIGGGQWRGSIAPGDADEWKAWWTSYREFILHYAGIAAEFDVESFVVGVELVSAVREHPEEMLATIAAVRAIYPGKITYSANWDEHIPDELWLAMDAIGTQLYPPLSDAPSPNVDTLRRALRPHLAGWHKVGERLDRPVWLTEVGYKSAPTAVSEPFGWPENLPEKARTKDEQLQATAYAALLQELPEHPRIKALYIWKYFTHAHTDEEGAWGFSPRGKLAEDILRQGFSPAKP